MAQNPQLSALSQKLIFKENQNSEKAKGLKAHQLLTQDALNVCKLLAIDPNDVIMREMDDFKEHGLSEQRLRMRYEYYEEKRQLKIKAIENILVKC